MHVIEKSSSHSFRHSIRTSRCRKIDQILIREEEEEEEEDEEEDLINGDIMELFTFDMDIDALWTENYRKDAQSDSASDLVDSKRAAMAKMSRARRLSARRKEGLLSDDMSESGSGYVGAVNLNQGTEHSESGGPPPLVLPTGPVLYNANVWTSEEMRTIRQLYSDGLFFQKFMSGLQSFYSKDWDHARQCFAVILERFEDGPSRYFMNQIEEYDGKPPRGFLGYGIA